MSECDKKELYCMAVLYLNI